LKKVHVFLDYYKISPTPHNKIDLTNYKEEYEMENTLVKNRENKIEKITMTPLEVSQLLGVSRATIYTMVRENEIPHFKIRGKILFNRNKIIAWTKGE